MEGREQPGQSPPGRLISPRAHKNPRKRPCELNEAAFDDAGEEAMYWAGFLMADGTVFHARRTQPVIRLSLNEGDAGHVESFRAFLGSTHKIGHGVREGFSESQPTASLAVASARLVEALARLGVLPRKSFTAVAAPACAA